MARAGGAHAPGLAWLADTKPVSAHVEVLTRGSRPLAPAQASSRCASSATSGICRLRWSLLVLFAECLAINQKVLVHLQGLAIRSYFCLAVLVCACGWSDFDCVRRWWEHPQQSKSRSNGYSRQQRS